MKTSIYIPTDNLSVNNLINIVDIYNNGDVVPDEIIINVDSVVDTHSLEMLRNLYLLNYDNVIIFVRKTLGTLSENRNNAKKLTNGDLILYHDVNTIPNMNRVKIIKKYFETNDVMVANHTLSYNTDYNINYDIYDIVKSEELYKRYFPFNVKEHVWGYTRTYGQEFGIHNVDHLSVCVRREVIENIEWKNDYQYDLYKGTGDGSGYEFELESLYKYNKSDILNVPLTIIYK